jgi:hypothetical protein
VRSDAKAGAHSTFSIAGAQDEKSPGAQMRECARTNGERDLGEQAGRAEAGLVFAQPISQLGAGAQKA